MAQGQVGPVSCHHISNMQGHGIVEYELPGQIESKLKNARGL